MKIAIDAREIVGPIAGKGRYVLELIKALAQIDTVNTYYLYSKAPISLSLPANFEPVTIRGLPGLRQLWLAADVARRGCDLLFAPTGYLPVIFSRVPTVMTVHDLAVFLCPEAKPALKTLLAERLLLGYATRRASKIIAVSNSTKTDLVRYFARNPEQITTTLLGYDRMLYQPNQAGDESVLAAHKLKPGYLLFIGTLEPRKNIEGLIRAYAHLTDSQRALHPLVIAGKKGWYYESIFATVLQLDLSSSVQFLGRVPDLQLPALYRHAFCFVFPSFYEGFGLPVLEAMSCGTPVITSNNSSLPEVVGSGGLLVDPREPKSIAKAMTQLLTDPKAYQTLKESALAQAAKFSWAETAKTTLAVFESVGGENR